MRYSPVETPQIGIVSCTSFHEKTESFVWRLMLQTVPKLLISLIRNWPQSCYILILSGPIDFSSYNISLLDRVCSLFIIMPDENVIPLKHAHRDSHYVVYLFWRAVFLHCPDVPGIEVFINQLLNPNHILIVITFNSRRIKIRLRNQEA